MKILHICSNEKFIPDYIKFINHNFDKSEHKFIVVRISQFDTEENDQIKVITNVKSNIMYLRNSMKESDKIIFHSLINFHLVYFLTFHKEFLLKSYWAIWGADLYVHLIRKDNIKVFTQDLLRKSIYHKFHGVITHIKGDYELARKWYGIKGEYYYSFMYPSNLYKEYFFNKNRKTNNKWTIQIGNSSDPSNNHIEILEKLKKYRDMDIVIVCPLSYGDKDYTKQVVIHAKKIFGDKFLPILKFMDFNEYLEVLSTIDIAIFNHKRQQAMGNITTLLGLGKKVYIRDDITTWQFCFDHDLKVYNVNDDFKDLFDLMGDEHKRMNIENVKKHFTEKKLAEDWRRIFEA